MNNQWTFGQSLGGSDEVNNNDNVINFPSANQEYKSLDEELEEFANNHPEFIARIEAAMEEHDGGLPREVYEEIMYDFADSMFGDVGLVKRKFYNDMNEFREGISLMAHIIDTLNTVMEEVMGEGIPREVVDVAYAWLGLCVMLERAWKEGWPAEFDGE